jgi:hypothetical protein
MIRMNKAKLSKDVDPGCFKTNSLIINTKYNISSYEKLLKFTINANGILSISCDGNVIFQIFRKIIFKIVHTFLETESFIDYERNNFGLTKMWYDFNFAFLKSLLDNFLHIVTACN